EERNRVTDQLQRPTFTVPVFVQREDAGGDLFTETQLTSDVRPPMATGLDQFVGYLIAVAKDVKQAAKTPKQIRLQAGVAQHEVDHLGERAIHQLEVAFEVKIVGEIEFADTGRIAAAPQILEQRHVIEVMTQSSIQRQPFGQTGTYPAT